MADGVSGDRITLDGMWNNSTSAGITTVQLADGTTLMRDQLVQMEISGGTTGNDTLYGTSGADLIDGKGGSDYEDGAGGNDTFVFDAGYGQLEINEGYASGEQPVLQLGEGITASALRVSRDDNGNGLYLADGVEGDRVELYGMFTSSVAGVAAVQLADGTVLTAAQLLQMEMTGTTGNDTLFGNADANLLDGKGGNDLIWGNGGNDTFVFGSGYGHLEIEETYANGQQPVLQLGAGITAPALHAAATDPNNLYLTDGVSGDRISLDYMLSESTGGVATVQLADGAVLTAAQLLQMEMTGTSDGDTLYGTTGADLIDGNGGQDSETGGGGNDTFVFNAGYGQLEISRLLRNSPTSSRS